MRVNVRKRSWRFEIRLQNPDGVNYFTLAEESIDEDIVAQAPAIILGLAWRFCVGLVQRAKKDELK